MRSRETSVRRRHGGLAVSVVGALLSVVLLGGAGPASALGRSSHSHKVHDHLDLDGPTSAAVAGSHLFVANGANNSVSEVKASNGSYVATISGTGFGFDSPAAIVSVGGDLFVANSAGNSVSEFSAAARHTDIRTISGPDYGFDDPLALASSGPDLFVLNGGGSLTEVAIASGDFIGTASGDSFGFDDPTGLAVKDGDVFVVNSAADSVTVVKAADLNFVSSLSGPTFAFNTPIGIASDRTNLWVTNQGDQSVTEFSPTTLTALNVLSSDWLPMVGPITYGDGYLFTASPPGASPMVSQITPAPPTANWMMCNTNGPYLFNNPQALVVAGKHLWVVNQGGNSLTEMKTDSGDLIRTVANP
jgi:hypothetical protein